MNATLSVAAVQMGRTPGRAHRHRPCWRRTLACLVLLTLLLQPSARAATSVNPEWPQYVQGRGRYQWASTKTQRRNGVVYKGAATRLRNVVQKLQTGGSVKVTALGGSMTAGHVQKDGLPWPSYVFNYLSDNYNASIVGSNAALGGSRTPYMAVCHALHVPKDSDVIMLEYAVNDSGAHNLNENHKRAQERLIRRLLMYPNKPAVIFVNTMSWDEKYVKTPEKNWFETAEAAFNELAQYYHLPSVSLKSCCFQELLANKPGFNTTYRHEPNDSAEQEDRKAGIAFFMDGSHIDGLTGARVLAELVAHLIDDVAEDMRRDRLDPATQSENQLGPDLAAGDTLPPPLFTNNHMAASDKCYVGDAFLRLVTVKDGWVWANEAKGVQTRYGMIATQPGAELNITLDTTAPSLQPQDSVVVLIAHLRSYNQMGMFVVECASGCTCPRTVVDAHWNQHHSQVHMNRMPVSQSPQCVLRVTVHTETTTQGHKIKLTGVVVSEEHIGAYLVPIDKAGAFD